MAGTDDRHGREDREDAVWHALDAALEAFAEGLRHLQTALRARIRETSEKGGPDA